MKRKKKTSRARPVPLQMEFPEPCKALQIVDPTSESFSKAPFTLPLGWTVVKRRRFSGYPGQVDKYYFEPGTGRQFRSLTSIQRYLNGEAEVPSRRRIKIKDVEKAVEETYLQMHMEEAKMHIEEDIPSRIRRDIRKTVDETYMELVPRSDRSASSFGLPDHWIVEERPRRNSAHRDRYFIEPETGYRFRSRVAALRYLNHVSGSTSPEEPSDQATEDVPDNNDEEDFSLRAYLEQLNETRKMKATFEAPPPENCTVEKPIPDPEPAETLLLITPPPPKRVKWVLDGTGGNVWNPFVGEVLATESEKQEWSEKFVFCMQDRY